MSRTADSATRSNHSLTERLDRPFTLYTLSRDGRGDRLSGYAGKSVFTDLLFRRGEPRFYAFDLLWCDGEDLQYLPRYERKSHLRSVMPPSDSLLYCDHIVGDGEGLFWLACAHDLEGIVAKNRSDPLPARSSTVVSRFATGSTAGGLDGKSYSKVSVPGFRPVEVLSGGLCGGCWETYLTTGPNSR